MEKIKLKCYNKDIKKNAVLDALHFRFESPYQK